MYQDLRSKIELYKKDGQVRKEICAKCDGNDIGDILDGFVCGNDNGSCFVMENRYPLTYLYGGYRLGDAAGINMHSLGRACEGINDDGSVADFLFLDTETTGLSGGTGTVAFLIGTGFLESDCFVLRQYFLRDYDEEPAALTALNELMSKYRVLVTFNGKAFDWNLLESRFIFNRIRPALKNPIHVDLLYPSRRIWKLKLDSCRLVSLEENILGEYRVDDIPGALIPSVYFKYLDDRDAGELEKVIKHNQLDILSMVALLTRICTMLDNPFGETDGEYELLGIGKIFEKTGELDIGKDCFESCMAADCHSVKEEAYRKLSDMYKRRREYDKAVEHWNKRLSDSEATNIHPMIELAKHYEHREKDFGRALEIVERAIQASLQMGIMNSICYRDLKKRQERLKKKAGTQKG